MDNKYEFSKIPVGACLELNGRGWYRKETPRWIIAVSKSTGKVDLSRNRLQWNSSREEDIESTLSYGQFQEYVAELRFQRLVMTLIVSFVILTILTVLSFVAVVMLW